MTGAAFRPGTVLAGRFALEDLLDETDGAGLWRATDRVLARNVAVHVLPESDARAGALLTAARRSALVPDPHLLRVLDAADEDGVAYVVHEWGAGVSLDRMLAEGPLAPRRAAWVVKEVAESIAAAHRQNVAHGRLLPESVLISETGAVKLIGFAVDAVLRGGGQPPRLATTGQALDPLEADVVNLAALLYAALVGRWPGTTGSTVPVAPTEHGRPLRPRQVRAGVPRTLDAVCERVLNPQPQVPSIASALEVYAALSDYVGDPGATLAEPGAPGDTAEHPAVEPTTLIQPAPRPSPLPHRDSTADPEATQASAPPFLDDESGPRPADHDHDPAPPVPDARDARDPRAGTGPLPPAWGPDAEQPAAAYWDTEEHTDEGVPGRSWLRAGVVLATVLVVVVAGVVALTLTHRSPGGSATASHSSDSSSATPGHPAAVKIADVTDFDPQGNPPRENPDQARLAHDGDPDTAWETSTYYGNPRLGGLKSGVGLLLDLGRKAQVGQVRVRLKGRPTSLELLAAPPGATSAPTSTHGMSKLAAVQHAGTDVDLTVKKPVTTHWLVVWLTSLPAVPGGYQGKVAEVSVRS